MQNVSCLPFLAADNLATDSLESHPPNHFAGGQLSSQFLITFLQTIGATSLEIALKTTLLGKGVVLDYFGRNGGRGGTTTENNTVSC